MSGLAIAYGALVCAGLVGLWKMGDIVVRYTLEVAKAFNVTTFFVGFVILALAADIPELAVAITAALQGVSEIAAGDIIGANFCDVAMVIGFVLLLAGSVTLKEQDSKRLVYLLGLTSLILIAVFAIGSLYPIHGFMLIGIYLATMLLMWYQSHQERSETEQIREVSTLHPARAGIGLLLSVGAIMGISYVMLKCALEFAVLMDMPLETVGASIMGMGTSLPELVLSFTALRRGEYTLALGTTLGTVLEQTTLILGTLTVLSPTPVNMRSLLGSSMFMFLAFIIISYRLYRYSQVGRTTGVALVTLFFSYLAYQAM